MSKNLTRRSFLGTASGAAMLALSACTGDGPASGSDSASDSGKLVIYSPLSEEELGIAIPTFEEQTGIKVEIVSGGAGELISRITAEADNPQGDLMFGGSLGTSLSSIDLWEEYVPECEDEILDDYRIRENKVSTYCLVPTLILVNNDLIGDIKITGWDSLLDPALKGKIAFADPAASSLSNVLVFNLLTAMGDGRSYENGWDWMAKFCAQLDGKLLSGSSGVPKGVADGEYTVGLSHELYYASYKDDAPITAIWPEEGSALIGGPIQIIKNAPNLENAKKFVEYVLGQDFQIRYMEGHSSRSVRPDVAAPAGFPAFDSLKLYPEPIVTSDVQDEVLRMFSDLVYA